MATLMRRRDFLGRGCGGLLAGAACVLRGPQVALAERGPSRAGGAFRFAFLTDIHVQPERDADKGFRKCVAAVNALRPRVDFVITGGDLVSDSLGPPYERVKMLWDMYEDVCRDFEMPVHHVIGNHDVLGWAPKSPVRPDHFHFGKKMFKDRLGEGRAYRSFDHKGWHFILLDSVGQAEGGRDYIGLIDDEQITWLKQDLARTGRQRPILVVTHIPFFSIWRQMQYGPHATPPNEERAYIRNAHELRPLLAKYNVKLILQGHMHVNERIEVSNLTFVSTGAVCGHWWKGPTFGEFPEGYAIVTIRGDRIGYEYKTYGWRARKRG